MANITVCSNPITLGRLRKLVNVDLYDKSDDILINVNIKVSDISEVISGINTIYVNDDNTITLSNR